jgi:8-amino-7-oxononanoate synthase
MAPPNAASALEALRIMRSEPERVERLQARGAYFLQQANSLGVNVGTCAGYAVAPVIIGASLKTVKLSNYLFERGVTTQAVVYPGVEEKAARLRFFICSNHTEEEIKESLELVAAGLGL